MIVNGVHTVSVYDPSTKESAVLTGLSSQDGRFAVREERGETDATGGTAVTGYESVAIWRFVGQGAEAKQIRDWMTGRTRVRLVAVGKERVVQWYESSRITIRRQGTETRIDGRGDVFECEMRHTSSIDNHDIFGNANIIEYLGWRGSDDNGDAVPDGWTETDILGGSQGFFDDDGDGIEERWRAHPDGSSGRLEATFAFPVPNVEMTLHAMVEDHANGDTFIRIRQFDSSGSVSQNNSSEATGDMEENLTITTQSDCYELEVSVVDFQNVTDTSQAADRGGVWDPALMLGSSASFTEL